MLTALKAEIAQRLAEAIRGRYGVNHQPIVKLAPRHELSDLELPAPLQLARTLKQAPRKTAEELLAAFEPPPIVRQVEIASASYLNLYLDRSEITARLLERPILAPEPSGAEKVVVEHTNINPNKTAHIGHLRNTVLNDVLVRTLHTILASAAIP